MVVRLARSRTDSTHHIRRRFLQCYAHPGGNCVGAPRMAVPHAAGLSARIAGVLPEIQDGDGIRS